MVIHRRYIIYVHAWQLTKATQAHYLWCVMFISSLGCYVYIQYNRKHKYVVLYYAVNGFPCIYFTHIHTRKGTMVFLWFFFSFVHWKIGISSFSFFCFIICVCCAWFPLLCRFPLCMCINVSLNICVPILHYEFAHPCVHPFQVSW